MQPEQPGLRSLARPPIPSTAHGKAWWYLQQAEQHYEEAGRPGGTEASVVGARVAAAIGHGYATLALAEAPPERAETGEEADARMRAEVRGDELYQGLTPGGYEPGPG